MSLTRNIRPKVKGWSPLWKPIQPPPMINYYGATNRFMMIPEELVPHVLTSLELFQRPSVFTGTELETDNALSLFSELRYMLMTGIDIVQDIRFENCEIEVLRDEQWVSIGDLSDCAGLVGPQGETGPQGEPGPVGPAGPAGAGGVSVTTIIDERVEVRKADEVWGASVKLVEFLEENVLDILGYLEIFASKSDAVGNIISAIPVIGAIIPVDELFKLASDAIEIGVDVILTQITPTQKQGMACDLFCRVMENDGTLTEEILGNWWGAFIIANILGTENIFDLIEGIFDPSRNLGSQALVNVSFLLGYETNKNWYWLGLNNPDSDWELVCDCDAVKWTVEFLSGHGPPPNYELAGDLSLVPAIYDSAMDRFVGAMSPSEAFDSAQITPVFEFPDGVTISRVYWEGYARNTGPLFTSGQEIKLYNVDGELVVSYRVNDAKGDEIAYEVVWEGRAQGINRCVLYASIYQPNDTSLVEVQMTRIRIEGLGDVPPLWESFVVPNEPV